MDKRKGRTFMIIDKINISAYLGALTEICLDLVLQLGP
jgi:hypothetical protein